MVGVLPAFRRVVLDQEEVVPVGVDMEVALPCELDHLHRQVVGDAVVEQQRPVRRPDLGPLVADHRLGQLESGDPLDGARVGASGAGGDQEPSLARGGKGGLVAGVDGKVEADDRPVEVECQQTVGTATAAD